MVFCEENKGNGLRGGVLIINMEEMEESGVFQCFKTLADLQKQFKRLPLSLPGRVRAVHLICLPRPGFAMNVTMSLMRSILQTLHPILKIRIQFHKGRYKTIMCVS